jgi:hypothetical protein
MLQSWAKNESKDSPYSTITAVTVKDAQATAVRSNKIRYETQLKGKRRPEVDGARRFMIGVVKFPMARV